MLKGLWKNVQTLNEAEYDNKLHESVLSATNCIRILVEKVDLENKDLAQAIKMLDAAKRGLGFVNKLPPSMKKAEHAQRVMTNLNKIRLFVNRLVKNQVDVENEELESFDVEDYFNKDMFSASEDPMDYGMDDSEMGLGGPEMDYADDCGGMSGSEMGDDQVDYAVKDKFSTPKYDMSSVGDEIGDGGINRVGSNNVPYAGDETIDGNEYASMGYENEEKSSDVSNRELLKAMRARRSNTPKEDAKNRELLRAMRSKKAKEEEEEMYADEEMAYDDDDTKMFRDIARNAVEDEEFQAGYGKTDDHMSMDVGNQASAAELGDFPDWAADPTLMDRSYDDEFDDDDMMMKGNREYDDMNDDSFAADLAPEEGGPMSTDYSDYDMENEEAVTGDRVVCLQNDCHYVGDFDEFVNAGIDPKCPECGSTETEKYEDNMREGFTNYLSRTILGEDSKKMI